MSWSPGIAGRAVAALSPGERSRSQVLDMEALSQADRRLGRTPCGVVPADRPVFDWRRGPVPDESSSSASRSGRLASHESTLRLGLAAWPLTVSAFAMARQRQAPGVRGGLPLFRVRSGGVVAFVAVCETSAKRVRERNAGRPLDAKGLLGPGLCRSRDRTRSRSCRAMRRRTLQTGQTVSGAPRSSGVGKQGGHEDVAQPALVGGGGDAGVVDLCAVELGQGERPERPRGVGDASA